MISRVMQLLNKVGDLVFGEGGVVIEAVAAGGTAPMQDSGRVAVEVVLIFFLTLKI
jgi:hypothetical protein